MNIPPVRCSLIPFQTYRRIATILGVSVAVSLSQLTAATPDLRNLTQKQYLDFSLEVYIEYDKNHHTTGLQAEQVIIGLLGLEKNTWAQRVFEESDMWDINTMLLIIANANRFKLGDIFISKYKEESQSMSQALRDPKEAALCNGIADRLVSKNETIPSN